MSNPPHVGAPLRPARVDSDPNDAGRRESIERNPDNGIPDPASNLEETDDEINNLHEQHRPI